MRKQKVDVFHHGYPSVAQIFYASVSYPMLLRGEGNGLLKKGFQPRNATKRGNRKMFVGWTGISRADAPRLPDGWLAVRPNPAISLYDIHGNALR
jgi:hypothetical protein